MQTRSIIFTIVAALLLFSAASHAVYAKEQGSLIDELTEIDSFHPPEVGDPGIMMYNEWHYFNVIDEEQNLSFMTTLKLSGDIYDYIPFNSSVATVILSYSTLDGEYFTGDIYPIIPAEVEYSSETPDVRINSSTVTLTEEGYHVHVESADSQTVFDAMFKPFTEPSPLFTAAPYEPYRVINWLVASPKMKVNGTLTTSIGTAQEKTYTLENVRGYHDHNWGYWLWQDDIGWDWGQASESKNHLDGNDVGKYAFCFGNVTNNNHTESRGAVLNVWKNKKKIARFEDREIQIKHYGMTAPIPEFPSNSFPLVTVLTAYSGEDSMSIIFSTENVTPIPIPIGIPILTDKYLVIWELTGTYEVSGYIDGKPVSYTSKGFMEYVA